MSIREIGSPMGFITAQLRQDVAAQIEATRQERLLAEPNEKRLFLEQKNIDSIVKNVAAEVERAYRNSSTRQVFHVGVYCDLITESVVSDQRCRDRVVMALVRAEHGTNDVKLYAFTRKIDVMFNPPLS